jgi:3,4-dihydroxy 2-butanone 4-phosphate synthase/GTP cyclohydrolase II
MTLNTVEEIIDDIRQGKMVVLMDDEDRENEGDLVMAASMIRPEDINFMASQARGLICLTLTRERCEQLHLNKMVSDNESVYGTNFTTSIEASEGVTTGISAADRARTIQAAVAPQAQPRDIVQPGHIFPIMAQPGGVLSRAGHTEAGCDLARMAGLESAAVIVEIMNEDGSMARRPDLEKFAKKHGLKIGTIEDLIHYRLANETTVSCVRSREVNTLYGTFEMRTYEDIARGQVHHAMVKGDISPEEPTLVRVHMPVPLRDLYGLVDEDDPRWAIQNALKLVSDKGKGVVVILGGYRFGSDQVEQQLDARFNEDSAVSINDNSRLMQVGVGSQILRDIGVRKMRLMSAPVKYTGIAGFDLEVVEYIQPED